MSANGVPIFSDLLLIAAILSLVIPKLNPERW